MDDVGGRRSSLILCRLDTRIAVAPVGESIRGCAISASPGIIDSSSFVVISWVVWFYNAKTVFPKTAANDRTEPPNI